MSAEDLLRAIGEIEDSFIEEAAPADSLPEDMDSDAAREAPTESGFAGHAPSDPAQLRFRIHQGASEAMAAETAPQESPLEKQREQEKEREKERLRRFAKPAGMLAACVVLLLAYGICYSLGIFTSFRKPSGAGGAPSAAETQANADAQAEIEAQRDADAQTGAEAQRGAKALPAAGEQSAPQGEGNAVQPEIGNAAADEAAMGSLDTAGTAASGRESALEEDAALGQADVSAQEDAFSQETAAMQAVTGSYGVMEKAVEEDAPLLESYENGDLPVDGNAAAAEEAFSKDVEEEIAENEDADADALSDSAQREESGMANPFISCKNMREAAGIAGFPMAVPGSISSYRTQMIFAIHSYLIDVIYYDSQELEGLRIRKATDDSGSISGDYTLYEKEYTLTIKTSEEEESEERKEAEKAETEKTEEAEKTEGTARTEAGGTEGTGRTEAGLPETKGAGSASQTDQSKETGETQENGGTQESGRRGETGEIRVTLKGNGGRIYVAEWQRGGYSYAIDATEAKLDEEKMLELVQEVE